MIFGDELNIHLKATVARLTREHIGFAYERIPPSKEEPLWDLLGGYADRSRKRRSSDLSRDPLAWFALNLVCRRERLSRSSRRRILPTLVFGSESRNSMYLRQLVAGQVLPCSAP